VGAGIGSKRGAHWNVVGRMVLAWVLTIPSAATVAWLMFHLTRLPTLLAWITVGGTLIVFGAWAAWAMMHTIHADDVEAEVPSEEELDSDGLLDLREFATSDEPATDASTTSAEHTSS